MTLISWDGGKPVLRNGKIGAEQGCCCQGGGSDACGCPPVTVTVDLTVVVPEPDPTNSPGGLIGDAIAGGTYTAQMVIEVSQATEAFSGSCSWYKCADTNENALVGMMAAVRFEGAGAVLDLFFELDGVLQPDDCCAVCPSAENLAVLGSPTANAGYADRNPSFAPAIPFVSIPDPCVWPESMSGTETLVDFDGIPGLDIEFSWEVTFS